MKNLLLRSLFCVAGRQAKIRCFVWIRVNYFDCLFHRLCFSFLLLSRRSTVYFLIFLLKHEINSKEMNCMNRRLKILEREWMESFFRKHELCSVEAAQQPNDDHIFMPTFAEVSSDVSAEIWSALRYLWTHFWSQIVKAAKLMLEVEKRIFVEAAKVHNARHICENTQFQKKQAQEINIKYLFILSIPTHSRWLAEEK